MMFKCGSLDRGNPFCECPQKCGNRKLIRFWIDVENRDYHYLSQVEIGGAKRISRQ
jgi:hypothetical protein